VYEKVAANISQQWIGGNKKTRLKLNISEKLPQAEFSKSGIDAKNVPKLLPFRPNACSPATSGRKSSSLKCTISKYRLATSYALEHLSLHSSANLVLSP